MFDATEGVEPSTREPKSLMLPLHYVAVCWAAKEFRNLNLHIGNVTLCLWAIAAYCRRWEFWNPDPRHVRVMLCLWANLLDVSCLRYSCDSNLKVSYILETYLQSTGVEKVELESTTSCLQSTCSSTRASSPLCRVERTRTSTMPSPQTKWPSHWSTTRNIILPRLRWELNSLRRFYRSTGRHDQLNLIRTPGLTRTVITRSVV